MIPSLSTDTLASATTAAGSYVYTMTPGAVASLQLDATWDVTDTTTITLKLGNDGTNFDGFASAKTLSVNGATNGIFELGTVDYLYLQVSWTKPATNKLTLAGTMLQYPLMTHGV